VQRIFISGRRKQPLNKNVVLRSMKKSLALILLLPAMQVLAVGPSLGTVTDVVITSTGVDGASVGEFCKEFKLSVAQVKTFFSRAAIVTQREIHDHYDFLPCFVRGRANFHGYPATWEIRAGGTGSITLMGGEHLPVVDVRKRDAPDKRSKLSVRPNADQAIAPKKDANERR